MSRRKTILVVEDSGEQLDRILGLAREAGLDALGVTGLKEALSFLEKKSVEYVLTDIHLSNSPRQDSFEGFRVLEFVRDNCPETVALAMSADPKIATYQDSFSRGALHFLRKPVLNADELVIALDSAQSRRSLIRVSSDRHAQGPLLGKLLKRCPDGVLVSDAIREVSRKIAQSRKIPVVITGETGTGKEEVAKLIHRSRVANEGAVPFIAVNCANLDGDLAAAQLFGARKGAYTGCDQTTNGIIGDVNGGILFLDEVHALPLPCQQRLLRVMNDGTYSRVGETKVLQSSFQAVVATTRDLDDEVDAGRFLLDLRMRLTGIDIRLESLKERMKELPELVALFFAKEGVSVPEHEIHRIAERCAGYEWKGNIRQLFKVLQALVVMASFNAEEIRAENLPVFKSMIPSGGVELSPHCRLGVKGLPADVFRCIEECLTEDRPLESTMDFLEKCVIQAALARHTKIGDVVVALDVPRSTLDGKRKKYGL